MSTKVKTYKSLGLAITSLRINLTGIYTHMYTKYLCTVLYTAALFVSRGLEMMEMSNNGGLMKQIIKYPYTIKYQAAVKNTM